MTPALPQDRKTQRGRRRDNRAGEIQDPDSPFLAKRERERQGWHKKNAVLRPPYTAADKCEVDTKEGRHSAIVEARD